ncbi:MAG TPA: GNAT family N-acetyltransferase [Streptosporangiaceae bacterium]|jgi:GNAT superfamily N-acetyltransferase
MTHEQVLIWPLRDTDRAAVARFIEAEWGALVMVVHGTVFHPAELPGFIAELPGQPGGEQPVGLLTYAVADGALEIVTLNAVRRLAGTGTTLLGYAVTEAGRLGCREIRLTTTNDNVEGLRFYQRRGFRLAALRPGAVDEARRIKPEIPQAGEHGIPLHDELDLVRPV